MVAAGVIDLTNPSSSPPGPLYSVDRTPDADRTAEQLRNSTIDKDANVPLEDGEFLPAAMKPTSTDLRKQRKRKKSQQDSAATKGENEESGDKRRRREAERDEHSRANSRSPPDRAARRRALREKPSDSLFFVDDKPADIRNPYVSPALAGPSGTQRTGGLVLPRHVKVAEGSSGAQEPPPVVIPDPEEDEEDFIDYLDTDGDRSVCISLAEPSLQCTLIQKMKDWSCSLLPRYPRN